MNIRINNVTTHRLTKDENGELELTMRTAPLDSKAQSSEEFVNQVNRAYVDKGKGFAQFAQDSEFYANLVKLRSKEMPFQEFSCWAAKRLQSELSKYPFADTGILVFAEFMSMATEYLLIAIVPNEESIRLDAMLDISATDHVDFSKVTIAARIHLSDLESENSDRYVTFIKGRVGRRVGDFFLDFLQAEVTLNPKMQSQVLVQAVKDFCSDNIPERDERLSFSKAAANYCKDQSKFGEEVSIKELSGELPPSTENGQSFLDYTQAQGYDLADSFPADQSTIKRLTKYVGAGGGINISFDALLLNERVHYDPQTDTLTIKGTPPNLRDQLSRG
ncbi:nucleoid-associated protein YejK [Vibrio sp. ABG19]|uniref:nucleoid-associated protein YejK n=1 Tax=Vibrio sp. ABG19 TaxID=2817385 RepID=UPI00249EC8D5|nr:nucleoid-associated protein YejK [Vibrio sp. ABG19]WGY45254.1 nucleoid-associated protein YejK [Vibrio sp. ABG19]